MTSESARHIVVTESDLRQVRMALMGKVLYCRQEDVAECNRAIALCDVLLGWDTALAEMLLEERQKDTFFKSDPAGIVEGRP